MGESAVGVGQPEETKEANNKHLTNRGVAVNEERCNPADDGRFDQIEHIHRYCFRMTGSSAEVFALDFIPRLP
jgi:hypothetical protein